MSEKETACLRDITETDIMEYMQVEHPHNEKELWKMKHATPARIGIGRCGARYTTEAQLRLAREDADTHTVVSVIAGGNAASVRLHEKFGFTYSGTLHEVGLKFGRYLDIVNYELRVG